MTGALKDLAAELGVSPSTVTRDAAAGMPVDSTEAARQWRQENRRQLTPPPGRRPAPPLGAGAQAAAPEDLSKPPADLGGLSYAAWRCRREAAEAQAAEMRLAEDRGQLVRVADLRLAMGRHLSAARDLALGFGPRLAPQLLNQVDQSHVQNLIDAEMRQFLSVLAGAGAAPMERSA